MVSTWRYLGLWTCALCVCVCVGGGWFAKVEVCFFLRLQFWLVFPIFSSTLLFLPFTSPCTCVCMLPQFPLFVNSALHLVDRFLFLVGGWWLIDKLPKLSCLTVILFCLNFHLMKETPEIIGDLVHLGVNLGHNDLCLASASLCI